MASEKESPPASSTDFSSYGVYDEKEQTVNYVSYNKTQIMDKLVEPENNIDQPILRQMNIEVFWEVNIGNLWNRIRCSDLGELSAM